MEFQRDRPERESRSEQAVAGGKSFAAKSLRGRLDTAGRRGE
jgi:hypothetical protein